MSDEIVRMILKSGIIDPFETEIRVLRRYQKLHDEKHNFLLRPQYSVEPSNVLKGLLTSSQQNYVTDVLSEITFNGSFTVPRRFKVNIEMFKKAMKKPELGFWSNGIRLWELHDEFLHPSYSSQGMSIFMCILRSHWETSEYRNYKSLSNFRYKLLRPMINLGLDVNVPATASTRGVR